jgi:cystathionine gamma-lyase
VRSELGLDTTYVDPTRPEAFAAAIRLNTRLIWVETPTNPLLKLCDIAAVAEVAHRHRLMQ